MLLRSLDCALVWVAGMPSDEELRQKANLIIDGVISKLLEELADKIMSEDV